MLPPLSAPPYSPSLASSLCMLAPIALYLLVACATLIGYAGVNAYATSPRFQRRVSSWTGGVTINDAGDLRHIQDVALTVTVVVVGAIVGLIVLATLFPTYGGSVKNLSTNFTNQDWGNATANSLGPIFGLLISLAGMFAIVGLVFLIVKLTDRKSGL